MDLMESEMKDALIALGGHNDWRERKPLFLLAKIEQARANRQAALSLARRAVAIDEQFNSIYLDRDREYLKQLEKGGH
jgi:hypothetical protein